MRDDGQSRRQFLGTTAAVSLALGARAAAEPLSRLSVGIVGPGGRGRSVLSSFFQVAKECGAELTAVCDLWTRNRERSMQLVKEKSGKEPKVFTYLDDMLDKGGLDAVIIATPDHAHAQQLTRCVH